MRSGWVGAKSAVDDFLLLRLFAACLKYDAEQQPQPLYPGLEPQLECQDTELCVPHVFVCDGVPQCLDSTDELNCTCEY